MPKGTDQKLKHFSGDQPRVRPFGTANIFEGKFLLYTYERKC